MDTELIVQTLKQAIPGLRAAYLFGSWSRGDAGPDSDVDLAFLATEPLPGIAPP